MNSKFTDSQIKNWENFCRHIGDWHGIWSVYDLKGELVNSFKCTRSFHLSEDKTEINHQNYTVYSDGKTKDQVFGPYKQPHKISLHLEDCFSLGSTEVKPDNDFSFEIGFKYQERRRSGVARYNKDGTVNILVISEHLEDFVNESPLSSLNNFDNWEGNLIKMTPDLVVLDKVKTSWSKLDVLSKDNIVLHLNDGISISLASQVETNKDFCVAVEWLVTPTLLYRGIRHFSSNFSGYTSAIFSYNAEK